MFTDRYGRWNVEDNAMIAIGEWHLFNHEFRHDLKRHFRISPLVRQALCRKISSRNELVLSEKNYVV